MIEIEMAIAVASGTRQGHPFANADVIVFVAEVRVRVLAAGGKTDGARDLRRARQRREGPEVGQISGRKQYRVALAVGARNLAFKFAVEPQIAAEQTRIAVADPIGFNTTDGSRFR